MSGDGWGHGAPGFRYYPLPSGKAGRFVTLYVVVGAFYLLLATIFSLFFLLGGLAMFASGDSTGLILSVTGLIFAIGIFATFLSLLAARLAILGNRQVGARGPVHLPSGEYIDAWRACRNVKLVRYVLVLITALDVLGSVAGVVAPFFMGGHPEYPVSWISPVFGVLAWLLCLPGLFAVSRQWKKVPSDY